MPHISHIAAYWLDRAMSIPGGAANPDDNLKVAYWRYIAKLDSCRILLGERY